MSDPSPKAAPALPDPQPIALNRSSTDAVREAIKLRFQRAGAGLGSQTLQSAVRAFLLRTDA